MIYQLQVPGPVPDVEEVRLLEWRGKVGHAFSENELLVELETHKAVVEIRASRPGFLRTVLCDEGEWRKIGEPLAIFSDTADEPLPTETGDLMALAVAFEII
jgi:pyruvate/2-oxoglutarate dehydrogenase complex dihydrolipoamide acyltransferase (E2) component